MCKLTLGEWVMFLVYDSDNNTAVRENDQPKSPCGNSFMHTVSSLLLTIPWLSLVIYYSIGNSRCWLEKYNNNLWNPSALKSVHVPEILWLIFQWNSTFFRFWNSKLMNKPITSTAFDTFIGAWLQLSSSLLVTYISVGLICEIHLRWSHLLQQSPVQQVQMSHICKASMPCIHIFYEQY